MTIVSIQQAHAKMILHTLHLTLLLIVCCHSAKSLDTISSIQGTRPNPPMKAAHRNHIFSHAIKSRKMATAHQIFHHNTHHVIASINHKNKIQSTLHSSPVLKPVAAKVIVPVPMPQERLVPRPPNASQKGPIFFVDDFSDPSLTQQLWDVLPGGGTLKFGYGNISLKDNTADFSVWPGEPPRFPRARLKSNPFPAIGDWRCSFIYSYNKGSNHLNSSGISISRADGTRLAYVHQDGSGQSLTLNNQVVWSAPQCNRHEVSIRKSGNILFASVDGSQIGQTAMGNPPAFIELGGMYQNETNWGNFDLNYIRIDDGSLPEPINGNNSQMTTSQPASQTRVFMDDFTLPEQSRKNWSINENGGSVHFQQGEACLKDDPPDYDLKLAAQGKHFDHSGFPIVKSLQNPFPANRNWKLQFSLSFNSSGSNNPDGVLIRRTDGDTLLAVGQDNSGEYAFLNGKGVWRTGVMSGIHTVILENNNDRVSLSIDGSSVGQDYIYEQPTTIQLGGSLKHEVQGWNNFDLKSISITAE